jgi:hypothetical protein
MEVLDRLLCVRPVIDHGSEASVRDSFLARNAGGGARHPAQQELILVEGGCIVLDVLARHDQDVDWSLRIDVPKGDDLGIRVHQLGRNLAGRNPAEQTITHGSVYVHLHSARSQESREKA